MYNRRRQWREAIVLEGKGKEMEGGCTKGGDGGEETVGTGERLAS